jgi:soluble lytic murein transglycosylase-like protein
MGTALIEIERDSRSDMTLFLPGKAEFPVNWEPRLPHNRANWDAFRPACAASRSDRNPSMRLRLFALLTAVIVVPQGASAQAPSQSTPDSGVKTEPAALNEPGPARVARQKFAPGKRSDYDMMVAAHAKANDVPESLVHRVIVRESKYQPHLVSRGNIGLMQIKLATARGLGYSGTAEGLRDANTNMTYAVKYLAGAWRTANGNADQAVSYYARGYYYAAKAKGLGLNKGSSKPLMPGEALQVVSIKESSKARRTGRRAVFVSAAPRLDELTEAKAQVGARE